MLADVDIDAESTEDDFHVQQLLQCQVTTEAGLEIGLVTDVINLPGQDVLTVDYNGREVLIPFVKAIVPIVDVKNRRIVIVPPIGLLDE